MSNLTSFGFVFVFCFLDFILLADWTDWIKKLSIRSYLWGGLKQIEKVDTH